MIAVNPAVQMAVEAKAIRSEPERKEWDRFVTHAPGGTIFQTWDWGEARRTCGWTPCRLFLRDRDGGMLAVAQVGLRKVGPWRVAYCQRGPVWTDAGSLWAILEEIRALGEDVGAAFVKLNPDLEIGRPELELFRAAGYRSSLSQAYMHRATYRVDLQADEESLLRQMEGRTRRAIARARRDQVVVDVGADPRLLERFEELAHATARRRAFAVPSHGFLESLLDRLGSDGRLRVSVARVGPCDVSAAVHLYFADRCSYMWGGSTDDRTLKRSNASEGLHWETMRAAKESGIRVYDFHGTRLGPAGSPEGGTAFFKRGFGGSLIRLAGDLDLPLRKGLYRAWTGIEPLYLRRKGGAS